MRDTSLDQDIANMHPRIFAWCIKLTKNETAANDLVQSAILSALENQHQFTPGTSLFAWICTIARNAFINEKRKHREHKEVSVAKYPVEPIVPANQDFTLMMQDVFRKVEQLNASQIPQKIRHIITPGKCACCGKDFVAKKGPNSRRQKYCNNSCRHRARYECTDLHEEAQRKEAQSRLTWIEFALESALTDCDHKTLAEKYNIPEGTVKSRIFRGRKELEKMGL